MQKYQFTINDQLAFAQISGDYNPIHVDPIRARRSLFGRLVLHGIHSVLWALDQWLKEHQYPISLISIQASFSKPIFLDEDISFSQTSVKRDQVFLELSTLSGVATRLEITWIAEALESTAGILDKFPETEEPQNLTKASLASEAGIINLYFPRQALTERFENLVRCLSASQIAALLGSTYIVGMRCPGLNSLYSELFLRSSQRDMGPKMTYRVLKLDERFNLATIAVSTSNLVGEIKAFIRPSPQAQPKYSEMVNTHVVQGEFKGQNALIVGGSRGLGEVTAKLLAAGGAHVLITYAQGQEDAQKVVDEINQGGGSASCLCLDVLNPNVELADQLNSFKPITHLYYFATPYIGAAIKGSFSPALFEKFCAYYIRGFIDVVNLLKPLGLQRVFYPSTVYIDELPANMGEYATAKLAAESLCEFINKTQIDMKCWFPRLPRMTTDQTISIVPLKSQDPVGVMLDSLRSFNNVSSLPN